MKVLIFDLKGKFAHFRKFYTNSSSLSYSIPPRTTISGIIAAVMGLERDSYYDLFEADKLFIALRKLCSTRKIVQSLNYMKATSASELINFKDHTQIPYEIVTSEDNVMYRIYLHHQDDKVMKELEERLQNKRYVYPPYLGAAPYNCIIEYIGNYEVEEIPSDDFVEVNTIIKQDYITDGGIKLSNGSLALMKEKMPSDFWKERNIKEVSSYIFDENGGAVLVKLKQNYYRVEYKGQKENIVFM